MSDDKTFFLCVLLPIGLFGAFVAVWDILVLNGKLRAATISHSVVYAWINYPSVCAFTIWALTRCHRCSR